MNLFGTLRVVAWLKRCAVALERLATAQEEETNLVRRRFEIEYPAAKPRKKTEISVASTKDFNQGYLNQHPELLYQEEE